MTPERYQKFKQVLDRRQPDMTVIMDNVQKPRNLAGIIRSCDSVGIGTVHAVSQYDLVHLAHKSSGGSTRWVKVELHKSVEDLLADIKHQKMRIFAAHFDESAVDYRDVDYTQPTALLMGAELFGVSDEAASMVDGFITIPQYGMVESLNVSVAAALILFEAQRQRVNVGLYDKQRISHEERERLLFEWSYPKVAEKCMRQDRVYPLLDEDGFLMNGK